MTISSYFEDPEGVTDLNYSVGKLSKDDGKVVDFYLNGDTNLDSSGNGTLVASPDTNDSVQGVAYLAIMAKAKGSATLKLTVKDGAGGSATFDIDVMVRPTNSVPTLNEDVWTTGTGGQYSKMSRTGAMRLAVKDGAVTVIIPADAFRDADGDTLKIEATIADDANP